VSVYLQCSFRINFYFSVKFHWMEHVPFGEYFPDIVDKETRTVICYEKNGHNLPPDAYSLIELYCSEVDCDCRRVMLSVVSDSDHRHHLTINFGWEPRSFYEEWMGDNDKLFIDDLKGPCRNMLGPDSPLADGILEMVMNTALKDEKYVERLGRHYKMFKDKINSQSKAPIKKPIHIERNGLCPCGSGKKYKKCCMGKE
jgi:hypothetical protein